MSNNNQKRLDILDSLRGLAALIVCFHHFFSMNYGYFESFSSKALLISFNWISDLNHLAVLFFFVLSGFSIGLSLKSKDFLNVTETNQYLYKRFKRILPVYIVSLMFTSLAGAMIPGNLAQVDYSGLNLLGNILFLQTSKHATDYWFSPYGLNGPLWSLSYEMFFYLLFPLVLYLNKRFTSGISLTIKAFALLAISLVCIGFNNYLYIPYLAFLSFFIVWFCGYLVSRSYLSSKDVRQSLGSLGLLSVIYLLFQNKMPSASLEGIAAGILISILFYTFIHLPAILTRLLKLPESLLNNLFNYTGKGSYALYALHFPLLLVLNYYRIPILYQLMIFIAVLIPVSKNLEEWFIRQPFRFLQLNYLALLKKQS